MMVFYVVLAILLFGLLIAVHEGGHFAAAKLLGVRVNEFAIGMGPKLWSKQKGETLYSFRAIPMGGFCAMEGEDEDSNAPDAFSNKPAWKKLIILAAGSFMNLVIGFIFVFFLVAPSVQFSMPVISEFMEGFPLESAEGLQVGDRILEIDGRSVRIVNDIQLYFSMADKDKMDLKIQRGDAILDYKNFPLQLQTYEVDGQSVQRYGMYFAQTPATPLKVLEQTGEITMFFARSVWLGFQMIFQGDASVKDISGPIGIVSLIGETGKQSADLTAGLRNVIYIIALIAVNLAIMNMLPIPALDGGRIFLLLVNRLYYLLTRRNINAKWEAYIHAVGFLLLILLMLVVSFQDVLKLFQS